MTVHTPLRVQGQYFDGHSSRSRDATLTLEGSVLSLQCDDVRLELPAKDLQIEAAIGTLPRILKFGADLRFESDDHAAVAQLERALGRNRALGLVNSLEARWPLVLGCLAGLLLASLAFWQWGLPLAARGAASVTPRPMLAALDSQTLALLDRQLLKPTRLAAPTRERLSTAFSLLARDIDREARYRLIFRSGEALGANAFALPNGTIVVTDDLVRLARNDREILGVLAHEVGHVVGRHGARSIYQNAGLLMFVSVVTGDVAAASTVAGALSLALVQNGYSRDMEREADDVAGRYLRQKYGTTRPLRDMLTRLERAHADEPLRLPDLLSTHPGVQERLQRLREMDTNDVKPGS